MLAWSSASTSPTRPSLCCRPKKTHGWQNVWKPTWSLSMCVRSPRQRTAISQVHPHQGCSLEAHIHLEGLSRANEALQTHRWPSAGLDQEVSAAPSPQSAGFDDDFSPFQHASDDDHFHEDHDDPLASFDQFASILLSLQTMRQHALSLPEDARRAFAEDASSKVADVLSGRPTRGPPCVDR
jgi:hypothetical protein